MRIPIGVVVVFVLCFLAAALLTYIRRRAYDDRHGWRRGWAMFEDYLSKALLLVMVAAATIQIVVRFLLSDYVTVSWTEELALFGLVWLAFWSAASVSRHQDHISLTVLYDILPAGARRAALILGDLVVIAITVPLAWSGFTSARWLDILNTVSLGVPLSTFAYSIPLTMALFALHSVFHLIEHIRAPEIAATSYAEVEQQS